MNNITEQILKAVEIVTEEKISKLQYDKTIKATVWSIVNLDIGEYKVRYNGNIFSAYSSDVTKTYKIDEQVYVKIPESNFGNKKVITGTVSNQSLSNIQINELQNSIFDISPDFNDIYGNLYDKTIPHGVIAGISPGDPNSYSYVYQANNFIENGLFQQYANKYELIRIKASFLTQFHSEHEKGNYGLDIEFYAKGEDNKIDVVTYRMDLNTFNGMPYRLSVYSPQQTIIQVQKNYLLGLKSIKLFEEDFEYDTLIKDGQITDEKNTTVPNIFVKDVSLQYVEIKDLSESNYYLTITAPKGIAFTESLTQLELQGKLIAGGKDIMSADTCKCTWFVKDLSVMVGEENYNKNAGFGWRLLEETSSLLTIDSIDVPHKQNYKLIVDYNNIILTSEIEIVNTRSAYSYHIEQNTIENNISLYLVNDYNDEVLFADWYLSYPDGSYSSITKEKTKEPIDISKYLKYSSVTFYCSVYSYDKNSVIGTAQHTIISSDSSDDVTISYIGEDIFRYDSNGDITIEDSEKDRYLQIELTWKEGFGATYSTQWLMREPDGKEILLTKDTYGINNRYEPPQSMIDKIWVDNYNILHYNIRQKYAVNFGNNTLIVKIKTLTEQEYIFSKEILFLKDGDQGTNGTTYVVAVRPKRADGTRDTGFKPLVYYNGWKNSLPLRCFVYKDGQLINDNSDYELSYEWSAVNVKFSETSPRDSVTVSGVAGNVTSLSSSADLQFYVKVQVSINDSINRNKTYVHALYPIDIAVGDINISSVTIDSIPSYIKYTASGTTPRFYSNNISCTYNDQQVSIESISKHILDTEIRSGLQYLKPATNFIFENKTNESNIGVLKCSIDSSRYIIHPIIMYLDTYGNEAINSWDGTSLQINQDKHYLFAPQVGAGEKDSENRFSGVVMGKDSAQEKIGLYGYNHGLNTFGLMQDGKAYFGAKSGGGQIVIDGTTATIYGGGNSAAQGGNADNGMTIYLANLGNKAPDKTSAIKIAAGKFEVTYDGVMKATGAKITGEITATSGKIGNWHIANGAIANSLTNPTVSLTSSGRIEARTGAIGGWELASNKIYSIKDNGNVGVASSGTAVFWAGYNLSEESSEISPTDTNTKFLVTRAGKLYCTNAEISGTIKATKGDIGGWKITNNGLVYRASGAEGDVTDSDIYYLSPSKGIRWGDDFIVSGGNVRVTGTIRAQNLYLGDSNINAIINRSELNGQVLSYGSADSRINRVSVNKLDGQITANQISVGAITAEKIAAGAITADKIAGGTITADKIAAGVIMSEAVVADIVRATSISADKITGGTINATVSLGTTGSLNIGGAILAPDWLAGMSIRGSALEINTGSITINGVSLDDYIRNVAGV